MKLEIKCRDIISTIAAQAILDYCEYDYSTQEQTISIFANVADEKMLVQAESLIQIHILGAYTKIIRN